MYCSVLQLTTYIEATYDGIIIVFSLSSHVGDKFSVIDFYTIASPFQHHA